MNRKNRLALGRPIWRASCMAMFATMAICLSPLPSASAQQAAGKEAAVVSVKVSTPSRRHLSRELRMPATLIAGEVADLYAKTSGYVRSVHVDFGSVVKKSDELLVLDVPEMADELRQAEAELAAKQAAVGALRAQTIQAEANITIATAQVERFKALLDLRETTLDRKRQLREANAIAQQEFDEAASELGVVAAEVRIAQAEVSGREAEKHSVGAKIVAAEAQATVAEANVARIKTLMQYATIRAPFDGVIIDRRVDAGAFVRSATEGAATQLLTVARVNQLRVKLDVPESDARYVRVGAKVRIDVKAVGGNPIEAVVSRTSVALKPETRTLRVEVDLDNVDGSLAPGMYAQTTLILEENNQALMVPSKALKLSGDQISVLVAENGIARSITVEVGYDDGISAEIVKGLTGDEQVIVDAVAVITDGVRVRAGS